jgi:hypothetical protein
VPANLVRLFSDVMNKGALRRVFGILAPESFCRCLKDRQICRAFKVKDPTSLLCLIVILEADVT